MDVITLPRWACGRARLHRFISVESTWGMYQVDFLAILAHIRAETVYVCPLPDLHR